MTLAASSQQGGDAAWITFDRDHARGPCAEQGAGQTTGAGADLEHGAATQIPGRSGDLREQHGVEQEMLAETFVGAQPEARDHRAQRVQVARRVAQRRTSTNASLRRSRR